MMERSHDEYMRLALNLARKGEGRTRPNPPVGAVVVRDGDLVGSGYHPRAGEPHAEVFALREASIQASGADLYVTLEPCCAFGKTGPCTEAILAAGIRRVFVGCQDPNPDVAGNGFKQLESAGVEVRRGYLEAECRDLIAPFARHISTGLPFVVYKAAQTLDGVTATHCGDSRWVSCEESRLRVHRLRDRVDAVLVGVGTVLLDNPRLTTRLPEGGKSPDRVIVDSSLRIPETAAVLAGMEGVRIIIATTSRADAAKIKRLENEGVSVLTLPADDNGQVDVNSLCVALGNELYQHVLFEGGTQLAGSMWRAGLIQRVQIYLAPKIYAGDDGFSLFGGHGPAEMSSVYNLENVRFDQCGTDLVIEGDVPNVYRAD